MNGYSKGLVAAGIVLITVSFLFVFPYVGFAVNKQYANVTAAAPDVTGLDPQDHRNIVIFIVLVCIGVGLLVKGFYLI